LRTSTPGYKCVQTSTKRGEDAVLGSSKLLDNG